MIVLSLTPISLPNGLQQSAPFGQGVGRSEAFCEENESLTPWTLIGTPMGTPGTRVSVEVHGTTQSPLSHPGGPVSGACEETSCYGGGQGSWPQVSMLDEL